MRRIRRAGLLALVASLSLLAVWASPQTNQKPDRFALMATWSDGNAKEAYEGFARLALDPDDDPMRVGEDLTNAVSCLSQLARVDESDAFIEKVIAAHPDNWRLLWSAAQQYLIGLHHSGTIVAGKFVRGPERGGAAMYVNSYERDRVRALQLMQEAAGKIKDEKDGAAVGEFYSRFAHMLLADRGFTEAWRLQYLSDLTTLPDYEEGYYYDQGRYGRRRGAPVNADGTPVYHYTPKSWEDSRSDGERWRWALMQMIVYAPQRELEARYYFAQFLHDQFDVQTMSDYGSSFGRSADDDETHKDESGPYAVQTLSDDETIAQLATGIKRFKLPDEFNFIRMFNQVAAGQGGNRQDALVMLGQIFENRRQYDMAADYWRRSGKKDRVNQIIGNWGQFESVVTQPAAKGATVEFRFRNGNEVAFEAYEIDVRKLLDDVKAYLKSDPKQLDWEKMNIEDIGYRLVQKNQRQYVGMKAAEWRLALAPRPGHFDKRITVTTPLQKAGAYLLTAKMKDGNSSNIIIWVADTAIVQKPLESGPYYFVADAVTGLPVARANVEFFGYWQEWVNDPATHAGRPVVHTTDFAEFTDADGQVMPTKLDNNYQWIVIATTPEGRLAYLGFNRVWGWGGGRAYDAEYNQIKVFVITDRPVYRPKQTVKFKFWINQAKYDAEEKSPFAGGSFNVKINDPKGEKIFEKSFTADEYGGLDGEFALADEAALGVYSVFIENLGGGSFRVEEYKKPEFEVKIAAPTEPVMLGEKITATIEAKYYFGAPVTEGKVKYKVLRSAHTASWYPAARWDWMYGRGYWWFAYDYNWYPGWRDWGCIRPIGWWWGQPQPQPEIVAEAEAPLGKDGIVKVEIDTAFAKAVHGDQDHKYDITAEVTDLSRRTIVGQGSVLVARKPFKVYAWVDRGHYRVGDVVEASFSAQTLDNKPVKGKGELKLFRITYDADANPVEAEAQRWTLDTNEEGRASRQIKAAQAGQYRLSYRVTDEKDHSIEGGYVFCVAGQGYDGSGYRFNDIELVPDKKEYKPGDKVGMMINVNRPDGCVVLFLRPANGCYLPPKVMRLKGKSVVEEIEVIKKDMPNFFVEAFTVSDGKVYSETHEIVVPPEKRVLDVEVVPSAQQYKPGEQAAVQVKLTDPNGEPFVGSCVVSIFDKSVEYISGGSNVPDIKEFFWKWRRHHHPAIMSSLNRGGRNLVAPNQTAMQPLGIFGRMVADEFRERGMIQEAGNRREMRLGLTGAVAPSASMALERKDATDGGSDETAAPQVEPTIRKEFADTALWLAALTTDKEGKAEVSLKMPENLTTWKARVWAMGAGARVGEGSAEIVTTKNLIIRLQAPRFFVQKDEVVLSANVHNYLKTAKKVEVVLEMDGGTLQPMASALKQTVTVEPNGEQRVDWRVKVIQPGEATVRMKALTDEESDAMQMAFPVYVHGMLKMESFCGVIRPDKESASIAIVVPAERRPEQSCLEIRWSPTLAGAMVDALPYMADYPYGCTEQTINRFLPSVITQRTLQRMGLNLKEIRSKRANLNAQEIGDDAARAAQWQRFLRDPVFDEAELADMVKAGINRLTSMQCSDGGWGWFSGWGECSWPHTTAVVVHGMQIARENDVAIVPGVLERGVEWLKNYQTVQIQMIKNAEKKIAPWKDHADELDAFVYMVLVDEKSDNREMRDFLYRDRNDLAVYAKAMFGMALHRVKDTKKRDMIVRNIEQYLVQDDENQTAYLRLPENNWWWCWYGSEYEAQAYYLKLLSIVDPKGEKGSRLVKYLINNRKHATYWNSTRDTAICIEAFGDYIKASGEDKPDMTLTITMDGKPLKTVTMNKDNLFVFDNKLVLEGADVATGEHRIELVKKGTGPLYFNAYLTNFTLEDPITKAGLEIKVNRKYYRLTRVDKSVKIAGARGQVVDQKVEKYERTELADLATVKSGDLVEIELEIDSKNDYEYIMFEDMKAAGFEPVEVRSGYSNNDMGAYMELRDERVCFFVRALARGKHSVGYRMRAEIPGRFSALPTKASAMYAPELKANSDEIKLNIED